MVRVLPNTEDSDDSNPTLPWLEAASTEFLRRFLTLLGGPLSNLHPMLALGVIEAHSKTVPWNG